MLVKKTRRRDNLKIPKMTQIKLKARKQVQRASEQAVKMKVCTLAKKNAAYNLGTYIFCVHLILIYYMAWSLVAACQCGNLLIYFTLFGCVFFLILNHSIRRCTSSLIEKHKNAFVSTCCLRTFSYGELCKQTSQLSSFFYTVRQMVWKMVRSILYMFQ